MFDPTKPVQTRDGRKARIICTDRNDTEFPIVALVNDGVYEEIKSYSSEGAYLHTMDESASDLINIPETKYLNVYLYSTGKSTASVLFDDINQARSNAINARENGTNVLLGAHPVEV